MKTLLQHITFERIALCLLTVGIWIIVLQNAGILKHQVTVNHGYVIVAGGSMDVQVTNTVDVDVEGTVPVKIEEVDPLCGALPVEIER